MFAILTADSVYETLQKMVEGNRPFYIAIGKRLCEARRRARLTQAEISSSVGLSRTSITNMEKGRQPLYVHQLMKIAEVLNVSPGELLPTLEYAKPTNSEVESLKRLSAGQREWVSRILKTNARQDGNI